MRGAAMPAATARGRSSRAAVGSATAQPTTASRPTRGRSVKSQATFTLYYPQGPPAIDVDVFQTTNTGIRDDDAEGPLVFSPSGFSVTAAELLDPSGGVAPFASNQVAGTNFASAPRSVRPDAERSRVRHHRRLCGREEPEVLVAARRTPRPGHARQPSTPSARRPPKQARARRPSPSSAVRPS